ncbi:minor tail protein [Mycobacterium phage Stinson]|nr:minor tail protein [Mycobacterium phage Stinson]
MPVSIWNHTYSTTVPNDKSNLIPDADFVQMARDGFDRQADSVGATIIAFRDLGEVPPGDIPASVEAALGRPRTDYVWRKFEADAQRITEW